MASSAWSQNWRNFWQATFVELKLKHENNFAVDFIFTSDWARRISAPLWYTATGECRLHGSVLQAFWTVCTWTKFDQFNCGNMMRKLDKLGVNSAQKTPGEVNFPPCTFCFVFFGRWIWIVLQKQISTLVFSNIEACKSERSPAWRSAQCSISLLTHHSNVND